MRPKSNATRRGFLRVLHACAAGLVAASLLATPMFLRAENSIAHDDSLPGSDNSSKDDAAWKGRLSITDLTEDEAITHALDRLGYGARPGDIERIRKMGLETWINRQLHPETLNDKAAENRLADYSTLSMSAATLENEYPQPNVAAKRLGITQEDYNKRIQDSLHPPQGMRPAPDKRPQRNSERIDDGEADARDLQRTATAGAAH